MDSRRLDLSYPVVAIVGDGGVSGDGKVLVIYPSRPNNPAKSQNNAIPPNSSTLPTRVLVPNTTPTVVPVEPIKTPVITVADGWQANNDGTIYDAGWKYSEGWVTPVLRYGGELIDYITLPYVGTGEYQNVFWGNIFRVEHQPWESGSPLAMRVDGVDPAVKKIRISFSDLSVPYAVGIYFDSTGTVKYLKNIDDEFEIPYDDWFGRPRSIDIAGVASGALTLQTFEIIEWVWPTPISVIQHSSVSFPVALPGTSTFEITLPVATDIYGFIITSIGTYADGASGADFTINIYDSSDQIVYVKNNVSFSNGATYEEAFLNRAQEFYSDPFDSPWVAIEAKRIEFVQVFPPYLQTHQITGFEIITELPR